MSTAERPWTTEPADPRGTPTGSAANCRTFRRSSAALRAYNVSMKRKHPAARPDLCIGYVRVSTEQQDLGPVAQREALAAYCAAHGLQLVAVHEDLGVSGGAPIDRRPGLLAALAALQEHGAGVLLVAKRCRLARDVVAAASIERIAARTGASVASADGIGVGAGPEAQLMRTLIDAFAAYERAVIAARTRAALKVKRNKGQRTGGVPYGYNLAADGISLEPDERERETVSLAASLRAQGLSLRRIGAKLLAAGHAPRGGMSWSASQVERLLASAERIAQEIAA